MDADSNIPLRSLSIYLVKDSHNSVSLILKPKANLQQFTIGNVSDPIGTLYVQSVYPRPPRWASIFMNFLTASQLGHVNTSAAVFLTVARARYFAIAFGQGRYLLNPDCIEERFGLRVALNSIGENKVRSIDKRTFDAISRHSREQASREVAAQDFGLDIEQDLLRAVTGSPNDITLGNTLSGMDSLHALVRIEINDIKDLMSRYFDKYLDNSYRQQFPWVDQIAEITSQELRQQLDSILVERLRSGNLERCWLAVPEIVEWSRISGFRYAFYRRSPAFHDIHFPEFLSTFKDQSVISERILRQRQIYCIGNDDVQLYAWPVYQCIYFEIDRGPDSFLLSGGKWYRVTRNFVKEVNEAYRKIPRYDRALPEYNDPSESEYIKRTAKQHPATFAVMDQKNIQYGGGYSKIEFCDLLTKSNDIIHVKRYGSSSVFSHLFSQGLISGELFQTDPGFRKQVNQRLPETHRLKNVNDRPESQQYQIVFAIISDSPDDLVLPFFSRLNLKHAARRLQGYGYRVVLSKISVNDAISKLQRYK
ncbi:MAG TPA: TIGR04141 family sporadically distributed protein [Syntrophales bacterium]|nr:TIGR04141 family sporadically distributed protein [Syntrophales bacterium]